MLATQQKTFQGSEILSKFETDLIEEGLINKDQLTIAKISQENLGLDLGSVLLRKGFVTENQLLAFIAKKMGMEFMSLESVDLSGELIRKVPLHIARQHRVVPLDIKDNVASVAMANPHDSFAKDDLKEIFKCEIRAVLANVTEIDAVLEKYFSGDVEESDLTMTVDVSTEDSGQSEAEMRKMQEMALGPKIVAIVNNIIARASSEKASDIHIEPTRNKVMVRYRVDGMLRERGVLTKNMQLPVISRVKILANLDIAERRIPQDGRVRVLLVGKPLDMRISTCPTQHGEKIVIRLLAKDAVRSIESLGFGEKERKVFSDIITKSHGIFLSTGPTGSGKSTTLYAALNRINSSEKNIISIEDPIENEIEGVNQVAVNNKAGLTFAAVLRSVLRQDPDVIMLGEIRDAETAQIAVRAAITGHMVISTLHTNTAAGAVSRLKDLGVEPFMMASALKGVMAQRLVRRICSDCKVEVTNEPFELMGHTTNRSFAGRGCKSCNYTGYSGRAGIFEIAAINEEVRNMIHHGADESMLVEGFRKMGVKSIVKDGVEKIEAGITTPDEVMRVTQED